MENQNGNFLLYIIAQNGHNEIIQKLTNQGAFIDALNQNYNTSLYLAVENGLRYN